MTEPTDAQIALAEFRGTPEQATAELARLAGEFKRAAPTAATDARTAQLALNNLVNNEGFARSLLANDVASVAEFNRLSELASQGDAAVDAIAGLAPSPAAMIETTYGNELPTAATQAAIEQMKEIGLSDATIKELFEGRKPTAQEYAATKAHQRMRHSDREWVAKLLSGSWPEVRESMLHAAILSAGIEGQ